MAGQAGRGIRKGAADKSGFCPVVRHDPVLAPREDGGPGAHWLQQISSIGLQTGSVALVDDDAHDAGMAFSTA